MINEYSCKPDDIISCIGPHIRKCHFEVDKDVYEMFDNEFNYLKQIQEIIEQKNDKWNIDTILINRVILKEAGLLEENIIGKLKETKLKVVIDILEPIYLIGLLLLCTAFLIDASFNPFLYFRF